MPLWHPTMKNSIHQPLPQVIPDMPRGFSNQEPGIPTHGQQIAQSSLVSKRSVEGYS